MLAIRADANAVIGLGHMMRCFALAEGWRARGGAATIFSGGPVPDQVRVRLAEAGIAHVILDAPADGAAFSEAAGKIGAAWLVADGPFVDAAFLDAAGKAGPVLALDDGLATGPLPCRLLLNQNIHARAEIYEGRTGGVLLCGPRYALIRNELRADVEAREIAEVPSRLLVLVGGADPHGYLKKLVDAALEAPSGPGLRIDAVIGPANPWRPDNRAPDRATYHEGVRDLGALIKSADLVLSSAGSTVWELSLHGAPMLLGASVPVEEPVGAGMEAAGAARYLGRLADCAPARIVAETRRLLQDPAERRKLSAAARALVDGNGVERVIDTMLDLARKEGRP